MKPKLASGGNVDESHDSPASLLCKRYVRIPRPLPSILHMVNASAGPGGSISPSEVPVPEGANTAFTVTPAPGYGIESVNGCGGAFDGDVYRTAAITGQCAVTASFTQNTHEVLASHVGSGTVSPMQTINIHGDNATFKLSPAPGYGIGEITATGCSGTLTEDNTYVTTPITSACQITVAFVSTARRS